MGGPKIKRVDPKLTAPDPTLRDPSSDFLKSFLNNPGGITSLLPPTSMLQQQTGNAWGNFLNQQNQATNAFNQANPFLTGLLNKTPGQDVLAAATPIFNRNLQQGADTLRQAGPRFASNTERLVGQQGQQAMQDFNLFSQQVMQQGINQQLQGAGILGQLGQGADQSTLGGLQGASQFALGEQGNMMQFLGPLMQQMFGTAFGAGGMTQPGTLYEKKPWWQQALNAGSQIAGMIPGSNARPNPGTQFFSAGGGPNTFNPPPFGSTFGQGWRP